MGRKIRSGGQTPEGWGEPHQNDVTRVWTSERLGDLSKEERSEGLLPMVTGYTRDEVLRSIERQAERAARVPSHTHRNSG
jgi:hypothetical protein